MEQAKFLFGDIVVVEENLVGVICKTWQNIKNKTYCYEVYVREKNYICEYEEYEIERYRVRHKYLDQEEMDYQKGL